MIEEKIEVLNEKQKTAIIKYLESRFGMYGVKSFRLEYIETPKFTYKAEFKQQLPQSGLGIFRHALEACYLSAIVWISEDMSPRVRVRLAYQHISAGTNGCDIDCEFYVSNDSEITEINTRTNWEDANLDAAKNLVLLKVIKTGSDFLYTLHNDGRCAECNELISEEDIKNNDYTEDCEEYIIARRHIKCVDEADKRDRNENNNRNK